EDNEDNLLVVRDLLTLAGVGQIVAQQTGAQAVATAAALPRIDLILLDLQLPNEDGYTILHQLRQYPHLQPIPVVAVTANVLPDDELRARTAGFKGFIGKPLDFDRFPQQIYRLLQGEEVWQVRP
ncbi:MAG: response regulator, partial [Cyanobacteria bacterium M5B4]